MEKPVASVVATCSVCGEPLNVKGDCLVCLLRTGLDESVVETKPGTSFGDYELLEEIGCGGQAVVYRARQKSLNRIVALKVIGLGHWESTPHLKRFRHEAEAAASLEHPQIVPIYEIGESGGSCYFSMKFVEGGPLAEALQRDPMSTRPAVELLVKIARTVQFAHEHGILHRDIKPGNILLDRQGEPHLTDFGLARLLEQESTVTHSSDVLGTPSYMSPEQAAGHTKELTAATDVYSLGAVLYHMLTEQPPFVGSTTYETIRLVLDSEPRNPRARNPKIDRDLSTICLKCLEKDPKRRYSSALTLAEDLEHWLKHEPIQARRTGPFVRGKKWVRRNPGIAVMAALLLALAVPLGVMIWTSQSQRSPAPNPAVPEKSIAVLPFENRSEEKGDAFFADGVQDEILTDLARVADLKVISRTSVMNYKSGVARNLREIGQQLGVANVVEGSVQRSGNRVRVNAQLVDARTDTHLWAQSYDRDLADVFAIQSEIAKTIADQLQAKLTGQEQQNIAAKPTDNLAAYDAYLRGLAYSQRTGRSSANDVAAQKYLREAVRLDPKFAHAWALLSYIDAAGYISLSLQPTVALREEARQAAETALTLQPNLGEALHAKGYYYYACLKDYDTAERYFEQARQVLPNSSRISESLAYLSRRRGQWDRSESAFNEAERRDPRNTSLLTQHALTYIALRRLPEGLRKLDQTLDITPDDPYPVAVKASIAQMEGDLPRAAALLAPLQPNADQTQVLEVQAYQGILERHPEQIIARLKEVLLNPDRALGYNIGDLRFYLGWAQEVAGDHTGAQETWRRARSDLEPLLKEQSGNYLLISALAFSDMGLGDNAAALKLAEGSMAGNPMEKDALIGARPLEIFARVAAGMGETDRAITTIQKLLSITYSGVIERQLPLTPALLRLDPMFDPLRGDPRFEKLVEEAKLPVALSASAANSVPAPEKSIAVLPFENLSNDKEDASFADGVQDDILTKLAKIADLKVISRTSVMGYRDQHNTRATGEALGVSHVLEGSVRKTGAWLHINAQLINARTDSHVWAEEYDRNLKDLFAIQCEIAQKVAERLHAKISAAEKQAIERPPTADISAFDLYSRAKNLVLAWSFNFTEKGNLLRASELLNQAVAHDPTFLQAYCQLAWVHDQLYQFRFDRTPERLASAQAAIEAAFQLRPDAGEAHLARAGHLYRGYRDYDGALAELETARQTLPNDPRLLELRGYIERRRPGGNQEEALRNLERAVELDPRNTYLLRQTALSYEDLRRYADEAAVTDRALAVDPNNAEIKAERAFAEFNWKADARPLHQFIDSVRTTNPVMLSDVADEWLICALAERDLTAATNALAVRGENSLGDELLYSPHFVQGLMARMTRDDAKARSAFTAARQEQEKLVRDHPDDPGALSMLGLIDAGLGRKEEALFEGRRAVELVPLERDAISGTRMIMGLARIAAWVGDKDLACEQLARASRLPSRSVTYGRLKLMPWWDPLRGDPCFENIVASLAPK